MRKLTDLYMRRSLLEKEIEDAVKEILPIGKTVTWQRGQTVQTGEVFMHGYGDRVQALNWKTGKKVWLCASSFIFE